MPIKLIAEFLIEARPSDQKIELLMKQMKLTPEQIELCIAVDPSPNQNEYVTWIARWLSKGEIRLPEDGQRIREQLTTFTTQKRRPGFGGNRDINAYNPAKLSEVLEANAMTVVRSKDLEKFKGLEGTAMVLQKGDLLAWKVTNPKALAILSDSTDWCTRGEEWGGRYLNQGPSFVIFYKGQPYAQLHPASDQFMDRRDHSLKREYREDSREGRHVGWGHYRMIPGAIIGTAITDPMAAEAVQALRANNPEVEAWVQKLGLSDPKQLAARLRRSEKYKLDACILDGVPLPPEEESALASKDPWKLQNYARRFHMGQRWEPFEAAIRRDLEHNIGLAISYARDFIKGRWPEIEPRILRFVSMNDQYANQALQYATDVIRGRWRELEQKFWTTRSKTSTMATLAAKYAETVLKKRWTEVVDQMVFEFGMPRPEVLMCLYAPDQATEYAKHFKMPSWPEFGRLLYTSGKLYSYITYLSQVESGKRDPNLEARILEPTTEMIHRKKHEERYEIRRRHRYNEPEPWEDVALPKDKLGTAYAAEILKQRWPELEQRLLAEVSDKKNDLIPDEFKGLELRTYWQKDELPENFKDYIETVVKGRWPEFEQALVQRYRDYPDMWLSNEALLAGYLRTLDSVKRKRENVLEETATDWPEGEAQLHQRSPFFEKMLTKETKKAIRAKRPARPPVENEPVNVRNYMYELKDALEKVKEYIQFIRQWKLDWPEGVEMLNQGDAIYQEEYKAEYGYDTHTSLKLTSQLFRPPSYRL